RLPHRASSGPTRIAARIAPTGAPSRARPSVPSLRWMRSLTTGMCGVHEANTIAWIAKMLASATRARRTAGAGRVDRTVVGSDTENLELPFLVAVAQLLD